MMIKYYTIQNPPPVLPEPISELPDECRQSDFMPLPALLQRFLSTGQRIVQYAGAQSLSDEEKEQLFEQNDFSDLVEEDISVQRAYADEVLNKVIDKDKKVVKEPTQPTAEPEKQPETVEEGK